MVRLYVTTISCRGLVKLAVFKIHFAVSEHLATMEPNRLYLLTSSLTLCIIGTCTLFLLKRVMETKHYANEPSWIEPKIPIIGHVIGLLQQKYAYYVNLL